jgi:hypothetical protein
MTPILRFSPAPVPDLAVRVTEKMRKNMQLSAKR